MQIELRDYKLKFNLPDDIKIIDQRAVAESYKIDEIKKNLLTFMDKSNRFLTQFRFVVEIKNEQDFDEVAQVAIENLPEQGIEVLKESILPVKNFATRTIYATRGKGNVFIVLFCIENKVFLSFTDYKQKDENVLLIYISKILQSFSKV